MTGDASLDDFVDDGGSSPPDDGATGADDDTADAEGESSAATGVEPAASPADGGPGGAADDDVPPAVPTFAWSPEGATCEACGTAAGRRWRDGDAMVCADCKEW